MKVYIIAYGSTPWQNGQLIHAEAKRQKLDVHIGFVEWPFNHLIRDIKRTKPDWIFLTGSRAFPPEELAKIANIAKLAIWDADSINKNRVKLWDSIKGIPSLIFSVITDLDSSLADKVIWAPQYYDAHYYKPTIPLHTLEIYDICFFGHSNGKRGEMLNKLKSKYNMFHSSDIFDYRMANIYRQSKIAFGLWLIDDTAGDFATSDRLYKAMGSGTFYLMPEPNNIELLFTPEVHLDTHNDSYELLTEQIDYYLANPKFRLKIKDAGRAEVLAKHTLTVRLKQYWNEMENF